ncbi:OLC1v1013567C1 [Oldenlandia corymbosa var. corymbosa]|uniref:Nucleoside diphosphate kinase n=1 Tax=Oldenlandia corymbosa var. corymbosa TaxID=529605 RepID=A0AAV1DYR2_OLDCO|nr:OLC1v1013567C1 [Oldenlandia corymbosa var. corymbosa]
METLAVALGGACPRVSSSQSHPSSSSSSSFCSLTARNAGSLSYGPSKTTLHRHLAAFQPPSHLFSCIKSSPHSPRNSRKAHIFLPHLVASLEVEQSYIMIKPDGVQRGLVGEIISRFEKKGFKLTGLKLFQCPQELAEEHYKDLQSKPFFPKLIQYITSGPVVCMAWEGVGVVASARKLIGATNPLQAEPGTIRGDLAVQTGRNVIHGSDSPENGKREIGNLCCIL